MTEELKQKAEKYLKAQCLKRKDCLVLEMSDHYITDVKQAYIDGATEATKELQEENKWHDLRKAPEDLPPQDECVFIAQEYDKYSPDDEIPMIAWHDGMRWISMNEGHEESIGWKVYAWHKIPKIPEEYK